MKRAAVLGFLVLCVAGVAYLLLETTRGRADRDRGRDATSSAERRRARGAAESGEASEAGGATGPGADDRDPNRVPGADQRVFGRVLRGNAGVAGATVALRRAHPWAGERLDQSPAPIATTVTGDEGRFELTMPRRRRVVVHAAAAGAGDASLLVFLPEEGDPDELTLRLGDGHPVDVRVIDGEGEPIGGVALRLRPNSARVPPVEREGRTGDDGTFRFEDVAEAGYLMEAAAKGRAVAKRYVSVPAQTHVQFVLQAGGDVFGTVTFAGGAPASGASVTLRTHDELAGQWTEATATTDAAGSYRVSALAPGVVDRVAVEGPSLGRQSDLLLPSAPLAAGGELRYDIGLAPGVPVAGRAVLADSGAPVPGARLELLRMDEGSAALSQAATAIAGPDGAFVFPGVVEGTYAIEALAPFAARRVVRRVTAGQPMTIDFFVDGLESPDEQRVELAAAGDVAGRILGFDAASHERMGVLLKGPATQARSESDDTGCFLFQAVEPTVQATVTSWNPAAESDSFGIIAGETVEVTLDPSRAADFSGVVVDAEGKPVAGARVRAIPASRLKSDLASFLAGSGQGSAETDAEGRYRHDVQTWYRQSYGGQAYLLVATHPGYLAALVPDLTLPGEGETVEVRLTVRRGATIRGTVAFADGRPAANLAVYATPKTDKGAPFEPRARRTAYTDFDGAFALDGIGDGLYTVYAYYRGGNAPGQEALAGAEGIELVLEPRGSISGLVVDDEGRPVTQGRVAAIVSQPGGGEQRRWGSLGSGGRFRIDGLDPGAYEIEATSNRGTTSATFETTRIAPVAIGTEDVVIEVNRGAVLVGRVLDTYGHGVAGAGVVALAIEVAKKRRNRSRNQARPCAFANGRGEFRLRGVGDKEVELLAVAAGYRPGRVRAAPGAVDAVVSLESGAVVEVRIMRPDGAPLVGQWIYLQAATPELHATYNDIFQRAGSSFNRVGGWQILGGRTDGTGLARLASLLPGEYRVAISTTAGACPPSTVRTGGAIHTVQLQHALELGGRVEDTSGRPIAVAQGRTVWVAARDSNGMSRSASVGAGGRFRITGLAAGPVTLHAWAQSHHSASVTANAGDDNVLIQLRPR